MKSNAICLVLLGGLVACGSGDRATAGAVAAAGDDARVTGTLMYRERVALRPGSVAEVWLLVMVDRAPTEPDSSSGDSTR